MDQWINQSGKRNTSRPVFTSHERQLAKASWKSSSARLNRDSYLPFGSCSLCLELARDPVTCSWGDIFCRECALANILSQKKELKRANKARRDAELEATRNDALQDEEDQAQVVKDFELVQAGLQAGSSSAGKKKSYFVEEAPANSSNGGQELVVAGSHGTKRKLALDEDELNRAAKEDRAKARRATEQEKVSRYSHMIEIGYSYSILDWTGGSCLWKCLSLGANKMCCCRPPVTLSRPSGHHHSPQIFEIANLHLQRRSRKIHRSVQHPTTAIPILSP